MGEKSASWTWHFDRPPADIWPLLADTARVNEAAKLPKHAITEIPQPDGSVNVDGWAPIRDLNRAMDWNLPDEEAVTVAGLVMHEAQAIPEPGQVFSFHGYRFHILRRTRNQITALRIVKEQEALES